MTRHRLSCIQSRNNLLWQVKVKIGSVLTILQKAILLGSLLEVRAVFSRDTIQGAIYAKANSKVAVERAL
ncbi:hypothetical protein Hypma_001569 [Hypsizygus marmoreus]|uniref:Uncharacterized protein n=1 Tax=Hypsizygus marmoreus TaxID=39966 RepID=A0A369KAW6_HYPMA|nr:hypothetical protein Hypma_001569 [Hypsizygus marmoreus]